MPLRGATSRPPRQVILASHLIFTGYAHWLPNDLRGSGSQTVRKESLKELGDILPGRQSPQPPRKQVMEFFRDVEPRIEHQQVWFAEAHRNTIAVAFGEASSTLGYTLWACAVCSNHAHLVVRTHRQRAEEIWAHLADQAKLALHERNLVPSNHPVWSHRPYKVFLHTNDDVMGRIRYVNENPMKEGLAKQEWGFVQDFSPAKGKPQ